MNSLLIVAGLTLLPLSLAPAQTTQAERAAAGDVVRDIDALQARLAPTKLAERLVAAKNPDRDRLMARAGAIWDGEMVGLSDWIGKHPGVGVNVFSSRGSYHTHEMLADAFTSVRHAGFWIDAEIMAAILFDYATDGAFREAVKSEHAAMRGLFDRYQENLKKAYAVEVGPRD